MNTLNKQTKTILILALLGLSEMAMGVMPATDKVSIRLYCFYIPNAFLKKENEAQAQDPAVQIKNATYEKLRDKGKSRLILATSKASTFELSEKEYLDIFEECQSFIKDKGQVLDLKGSDASWPETLSRFYRVTMTGTDENVLLSLSDPEVIKNLGIEGVFKENIESVIKENPGLIRNLASYIANNKIAQTAKNAATSEYTGIALAVAGTLAAAWFAPPYMAGAMELLYPLVYGALFGIPSKFGLSYWLVYYPSKMHAIAWAYNNAALITTIAGAVLGAGYKLLIRGFSKEEIKTGLERAAEEAANQSASASSP